MTQPPGPPDPNSAGPGPWVTRPSGHTPPGYPPPGYPPPGYPPPGYAPPPGYPPPGYAPPGYPPPGAWAGGPPPRRRRSRWLTVGLPIAGGLLLFGGCGAAVVGVMQSVQSSVGPAQDAAKAYASALVEHRWDDARQQLCARDRSAVSSAQLAAHYLQPPLTGYRIDGVNVSDVNGEQTAQVSLVLDTGDGLSNRTSLALVKEGSAWHPCP